MNLQPTCSKHQSLCHIQQFRHQEPSIQTCTKLTWPLWHSHMLLPLSLWWWRRLMESCSMRYISTEIVHRPNRNACYSWSINVSCPFGEIEPNPVSNVWSCKTLKVWPTFCIKTWNAPGISNNVSCNTKSTVRLHHVSMPNYFKLRPNRADCNMKQTSIHTSNQHHWLISQSNSQWTKHLTK